MKVGKTWLMYRTIFRQLISLNFKYGQLLCLEYKGKRYKFKKVYEKEMGK